MGDFGIAKARFFGNSQGWDIVMNSHSGFFCKDGIRPGSSHFQKKTYLVLSLNTIFIHFPVVLLNILIILMMFQLFW